MASYNIVLSPSSVTWDLSQATKSVRVYIDSDESAAVVYQADIANKTQTYLKYTHSSGSTYIDISATDNLTVAGTYTIIVTGTARVNYAGYLETKDISHTFRVTVTDSPSPIQVTKPTLLTTSFYYTGSPITIQATTAYWSVFNANAYNMTGQTSGTDLGTYTITLVCKTGYEFTDGTTSASYLWSIINRTLTKPTLSTSTLYYSGSQQRITDYLSGFDSTTMITSGQTAGINLGSYTLTVSCRTGYEFSDGTTSEDYPWTITKRSQTISVSPSSFYMPTASTRTATVSGANTTITATADRPLIISPSVSGSTITLTSNRAFYGTATVSVQASENDYYFASNVVTISVEVYDTSYSNIKVYHNGWKTVQPWVYHNGQWRPVNAYVYHNGWKQINENGG